MHGEQEKQSSWWSAPFASLSTNVRYYATKLYDAVSELPDAVTQTYRAVTTAGSAAKQALQSSWSANVIHFAVPITASRFAIPVLAAGLRTLAEEDTWTEAAIEPALNIGFAILYSRLYTRMLAANTIITLGGTMMLNEEVAHSDFTQVHESDDASSAESQAAIITHFLVTTPTVMLLQYGLSSLSPSIGAPTAFLLGAYWQGVVYFQYVLDRHEVDAEKQVAIANTDIARCLVLGALVETGSRLPQLIYQGFAPEWGIALSNVALMLAPVLAQKLDFHVPAKEATLSTKLNPILITWDVSLHMIRVTQAPLKKFLKGLSKGGSSSPAAKALWVLAKDCGHRVTHSTVARLTAQLMLPTELTDFAKFVNYQPVKPFAAPAHQRVTDILTGINTIAQHPGFKAVRFSLRIPVVGKLLTRSGAAYCRHRLGIPSDIVKLLAKIIKRYDLETLARQAKAIIDVEIEPTVQQFAAAQIVTRYVPETQSEEAVAKRHAEAVIVTDHFAVPTDPAGAVTTSFSAPPLITDHFAAPVSAPNPDADYVIVGNDPSGEEDQSMRHRRAGTA